MTHFHNKPSDKGQQNDLKIDASGKLKPRTGKGCTDFPQPRRSDIIYMPEWKVLMLWEMPLRQRFY